MLEGLLAMPAYNEEAALEGTLDELCRFWPREDILVVDDGSRDRTYQIASSKGIKTLRHPTNLGYSVALQTAAFYAQLRGYRYLVFMDADGQHDARSVKDLTDQLLSCDLDLVIGSRFMSGVPSGTPLVRRIVMFLISQGMSAVLRQRVTDTSSGFKAIHSRIFSELHRGYIVDFHSEFLVYLRLRGYKLAEVPVVMQPRLAGESMHNWASLLTLPARTFVGLLAGTVEALSNNRQGKVRKE